MDSDRVEHFRTKLSLLQSALEGDGKIKVEPNRDSPSEKTDDDHQPLNEMLQSIASSRNKNYAKSLNLIKDALDKIKRYPEEFGLCQECEEPIPERRLEMMPYAQFCVRCQAAQEDSTAGRRRHLTDYN